MATPEFNWRDEDAPAIPVIDRLKATRTRFERELEGLLERVRELQLDIEALNIEIENTKPAPEIARDQASVFRDTCRALGSFTKTELQLELNYIPKAKVNRLFEAALLDGRIKRDGKVAGQAYFTHTGSAPVPDDPLPDKKTPPEKLPPAGLESMATGLPVRVSAAQKASRRSRSTPGVRHQIIQRDKRYNAMQEAKEKRSAEDRKKAAAAPNTKNRKPKRSQPVT